tara:strand:- start:229 stop:552 length:324 start_codon:yes stop_codon:yes gene_type:complete
MADFTITLDDAQIIALDCNAGIDDLAFHAQNFMNHRAKLATDEIVKMYTNRALDEGISIPSSREEIVADALDRGWIKTIAQQNAEYEQQKAEKDAAENAEVVSEETE